MNNSNILFSSEYLEDCEIAVAFQNLVFLEVGGSKKVDSASHFWNKTFFFTFFMFHTP